MASEQLQALIPTKIDWVQGTVPVDKLEEVLGILRWTQGEEQVGGGMEWYASSLVFPTGARIGLGGRTPSVAGRFLLSLPGKACDSVGLHRWSEMLGALSSRGFKCTRLDLAADDYLRRASMADVQAASEAHHYYGFWRSNSHVGRDGREVSGHTVYFGLRGNKGKGVMVRVYDKALESEGQINAVRWEVEFTGDHADKWFGQLSTCGGVEDLGRVAGQAIGGAIEFRERPEGANDRHRERAPFAWWQKLLELLGRAVLKVDSVPATLQAFAEWVPRTLGRKICRVVERIGYALLPPVCNDDGEIVDEGQREIGWQVFTDLIRTFRDNQGRAGSGMGLGGLNEIDIAALRAMT